MKKNVLHILVSNKLSGAENVVCNIIENDKNYNMFYCSPKGEINEVLNEKNIKYIELKNITRIVQENRIDLIVAHDFIASCVTALKIKNIPIISYIHCNPKFIKTWNILSLIFFKMSKKFKKIVFVSKEAAYTTIFYEKIRDKIRIIDNVINIKKIEELSKKEETKKYDLLYVGRLIDIKQPLLVIEIIKELNDKNIKCCMLGDGVLYNACKKKIEEYDLENNIDLMGFKSNPYIYMKNSKILIMPSKFEGLPLTCIEAMSLKTIVLNSGKGGLNNIFDKNKDLICKSKEEYKNKIKHYLMDEQALLNMQETCLKISKKYTDMEEWIQKINNVLGEK